MKGDMVCGLGLYLSDFELRSDAVARLYGAVSENRANKIERRWKREAPGLPLEKYLEVSFGACPLEELIAGVINENVFGRKKTVIGVAGSLYVPAALPKTDYDKWQMPTEKEVRDAITEYTRLCFKNVYKRDVRYQMFCPK